MRSTVAVAAPFPDAPSADTLPLVTLSSGDLARLDSAGTATVRRVDPAPYFAWTGGALAFNGTPLGDVLPQLARWYDLDIHIDPRLGSRELTTDFSVESAPEMLRVLQIALNVQVERHGHLILLTPPSPSR